MRGQRVLFSSARYRRDREEHDARDDWETPPEVFEPLHAEFGFTLDPCANATNAKARHFFTEEDDGLAQSWAYHTVFMNPPYSQFDDWLRKAVDEVLCPGYAGPTVVALIPARTDRVVWHELVMSYADEIRFVKGRVQFILPGKAPNSAPFPSAIVVFRRPERSLHRSALGFPKVSTFEQARAGRRSANSGVR